MSPFFPSAHRVPRVDDRRVISGLIDVLRQRGYLAESSCIAASIGHPLQADAVYSWVCSEHSLVLKLHS